MKKIVLLVLFFLTLCVSAQIKIKDAFPNLAFLQPLDFQMPDDGTNRVFIVTQEGVIYVFPNDSTASVKNVFLDIKAKVKAGGELGLLGLVFHPDYKTNGFFYVNYTADSPLRTIIARYKVSSDPNKADVNSEFIIIEINQPFTNHNAGQLAFGPDGYFYFGMGDGGSGGDPQNHGQNRATLLGSMIRIDVNKTEGNRSYTIPSDNPFYQNTNGYREEIWAYGLRNPWRFSFDTETGVLWTGDVGQNAWEEVHIIEKGKNYGWRIMEGFHCYEPSSGCDQTGLELPLWEYGHNDSGGYSITGGFVYRGSRIPELQGKYIYADFVSGRIWALSFNGKQATGNQLILESAKSISSFGVDLNNELYICTFNGKIYKFIYDKPSSVPGGKVPEGYGLLYNLPNPFNPSTTIIAEIKEDSMVDLTIYTIDGSLVKKIFSEFLKAGTYEYLWDAYTYPSGVYIARLDVKNPRDNSMSYHASTKLVLLK